MKLSRQQSLIVDALKQHADGCESDPRGTCMRHLVKCGYRYTERVRELRKKGFPIIAVQIGRGHFHYLIDVSLFRTDILTAAESLVTERTEDPQLFNVKRVGEASFEVPSGGRSS